MRRYSPFNLEHVIRSHMVYTSYSGERRIHGGFRTLAVKVSAMPSIGWSIRQLIQWITCKDQEVEEAETITLSMFTEVGKDEPYEASGIITLYSYNGDSNERPAWYDRNKGIE
jgi:hypothetical protein